MIKEIKQKIKQGIDWVKRKIRWVLVGTGIVGTAMALSLSASTSPSQPSSQPGNYVLEVNTDFKDTQFGELRTKVDPFFNQLHADLSDAYYNYWKLGLSKPFQGYDVKSTPEESKEQFDKLHGLIFMLRDLKFNEENLKQPPSKRIPESLYDIEILGSSEESPGTQYKKSDLIQERINRLKTEGIEIKI